MTTPRAPGDHGAYSLYTGTTDSINIFYAQLEQKVGLCNVGEDRGGHGHDPGRRQVAAQGRHGEAATEYQPPTTPVLHPRRRSTCRRCRWPPRTRRSASGGIYCAPIALTKIIDDDGKSLPVPSAGCHQAHLESEVANAVNYILQGVLTFRAPPAAGIGALPGYQAAGKTGTSNVASGNGTPYAAFAGYTTAPGRLHLGVQPDLADASTR